jgi:protein required for attachment to host cells
MKNWWVVANASRARILEAQGDGFVHVADLVHPQSRQKGIELGSDRPGHVPGKAAHGTGSSALDARTDPHTREHEHFAREVAAAVDDGLAAGRCAGLVLVASNPFLGLLKQHLGEAAQKALLRTVAADYTALDERELARRLAPPGGG